MSLRTYHEKRRFGSTPEPRGKARQHDGPLRFVVQKHQASRLHYDFRLEMDGVLKSWAIPKGPSLNPADKRLAVMVEDHPLEYGTFEGVIPKGNYGAGTVMVWDEGVYAPLDAADGIVDEKKLLVDLEAGHLRFVLNGHKLRGGFSLVKLQRSQGNEWLLLKRRDQYADESDVLQRDRSAISRRTMKGIAEAKDAKMWSSSRPARGTGALRVPGAPRAALPHGVKPMLATLVEQPFDRAGWVFEIKWDGFRAIAEIENGKARLYSRRQLSYEERFPALAAALARLGHDAVLDGEIVVLDKQGKSRFQLLQNYRDSGEGTLAYLVFDILYLDGQDLRGLPLVRRKEILAPLLQGNPHLRLSEHVEEHGLAFFRAAQEQGLEGIIAKRAESRYRPGVRGWDWLKVKARREQEAVIGGFTAPRGTRQQLGALVLGVFENDELVYVGHAGGGFDAHSLQTVGAALEALIQPACPFKMKPKTNAPVQWVKPTLVCDVVFQEWTRDGLMRQPIFVGLREDKPARSVTRELPQELPETIQPTRTQKPRRETPARRKPRAKR